MLNYQHFIFDNIEYIATYVSFNMIKFKEAGRGNKKEMTIKKVHGLIVFI